MGRPILQRRAVFARQDVSSVTTMAACFQFSTFNGVISNWDVSEVVSLAGAFERSSFGGNIADWTTSCTFVGQRFRNVLVLRCF